MSIKGRVERLQRRSDERVMDIYRARYRRMRADGRLKVEIPDEQIRQLAWAHCEAFRAFGPFPAQITIEQLEPVLRHMGRLAGLDPEDVVVEAREIIKEGRSLWGI